MLILKLFEIILATVFVGCSIFHSSTVGIGETERGHLREFFLPIDHTWMFVWLLVAAKFVNSVLLAGSFWPPFMSLYAPLSWRKYPVLSPLGIVIQMGKCISLFRLGQNDGITTNIRAIKLCSQPISNDNNYCYAINSIFCYAKTHFILLMLLLV